MRETEQAIAALAAEMAANGTDREAPVREVMALLGDRWSTLILRVLATLSAEQAISQRVLTLKLRTLERDGFVLRRVSGDVPPKVAYRLSQLGENLHRQARGMIDWVKANSAKIGAARDAFDVRED